MSLAETEQTMALASQNPTMTVATDDGFAYKLYIYVQKSCFRVIYTAWPKNWHIFVRLITSPNIGRFSNFFHCQNQKEIFNNTITKDPTTLQMCHYTTL